MILRNGYYYDSDKLSSFEKLEFPDIKTCYSNAHVWLKKTGDRKLNRMNYNFIKLLYTKAWNYWLHSKMTTF